MCEVFEDLHIFVVGQIVMHVWTVFLERGYRILQENISGENKDDISKRSCTVFQRLIV